MKRLVLSVVFVLVCTNVHAIYLFEHSDVASKNAVLINAQAVSFYITGAEWVAPNIGFSFEYIMPFILPFSIGTYLIIPKEVFKDPNLKSFGVRVGYHFDFEVKQLDVYVYYNFDFGWTRNDALEKAGDEKQEIHYYDFRGGVRWMFNKMFGAYIETGYKALSINIGLSFKLN